MEEPQYNNFSGNSSHPAIEKCDKPLLCDYCINRRLAELKRKRDQEEREAKVKFEQQQLDWLKRIEDEEKSRIEEYKKSRREQANEISEELEYKFKSRRNRNLGSENEIQDQSQNFLEQAMVSKQKYREELLKQVNEKRLQKVEEDKKNKEFERIQLETIESERNLARQDLCSRAYRQREELKRSLEQQIFEKQSKRRQENYEKKVEKELVDRDVARFQDSQSRWIQSMRGSRPDSAVKGKPQDTSSSFFSDCDVELIPCASCHKPLPASALTQFSD